MKSRKEVLFSGYWIRLKQPWVPVLFAPYVEQPLIDAEEINRRLEALEELNEKPMLRDEIREYLNPVYDLERLISRISLSVCKSKRYGCICVFSGNDALY